MRERGSSQVAEKTSQTIHIEADPDTVLKVIAGQFSRSPEIGSRYQIKPCNPAGPKSASVGLSM